MLLGSKTILEEINNGNIVIDPFDEKNLNPNSYNLTLSNTLMVYTENIIIDQYNFGVYDPLINPLHTLDMKKDNPTSFITFDEKGIILQPGILYLGSTNERTFTEKYVPMIEGRSSVGRLGLNVHVTAGFGDVGFNGTWTLELVATQPVIVYPNVPICQISYTTISDNSVLYTSEKYNGQNLPRPSKLWMDDDFSK